MIVREMNKSECAAVIAQARVARLAVCRDGQPYVVPVHFAFASPFFYSFTMPGQKIEWMRENPKVCVLVEQSTAGREWRSVVAYGRFEELPDRIGWKRERDHAWSMLGQHPSWWEPGGLKPAPGPSASASEHLFYRIEVENMTGRQSVEAD